MAGIFVFSEDPALTRQLLTPGLELKRALAQPLVALTRSSAEAGALAGLGADRVVLLRGAGAPEALAPAVAALASAASVVLVGGTLRGKHLAAHVAATLGAGLSTDARTLRVAEGRLETTRILYGGLAVGEESLALPAVATVPPRTFPAPAPAGAAVPVETLDVAPDARVEVLSTQPAAGEGVDIGAATRLVAVGRGFNARADLDLAVDLAGALQAELACTRGIAEDEHWLPVERYIGISGQTVKPELYVAAGLSGQVQHMVGCREAKVIVAINKDERAPIFEAADFGIVGDLYTVLPLLTAALKD
ncbi:electron transfer flavoprotein subunit alpha/FixB family protein [Mesoterricola silvestris]|uniref:Protein FixB n=1 Tax=Mesoterricola silvestris TaxID=2927979 RepID=A0AA48GS66_9BACT|nr:FAD-binding protein [Mesoterricola silvestris]BDU73275.1 protein FixB [Mesoterricola silvestris]